MGFSFSTFTWVPGVELGLAGKFLYWLRVPLRSLAFADLTVLVPIVEKTVLSL